MRWHDHRGRHHGPPHGWRPRWGARPRLRRLQTRLFVWFLAAILAAVGASMVALWAMRTGEEAPSTASIATRAITNRVARDWDDPEACDRYVARVHELIGLDVRLRRDVEHLPHRMAMRNGVVTFDAHGLGFLPVIRDGELVGAVEIDSGMVTAPHWNGVVALAAAMLVLAMAARFVARRLAWPLEDVADAAERFGGGDLTARTQLGGRRRWVAQEVRGVAQAFDGMAERIERVVRDQRELLGAISHELRSPLGRARVALEIARERGGEGTHASLDDIEHQLTDVDAILGDLLAAARAGLSDVKPVPTAIAPWLRARIASEPPRPTIELTCEVSDELTAPIDAALLNRALHNVLANARVHGHPDGEPIDVRLEASDTRITLVTRDRGPGFPPDLLSRAFEPFVKGDVARTPGTGYGLGLSLVRRIAEAHGGSAFARNAEGGGAEVGIELPRGG